MTDETEGGEDAACVGKYTVDDSLFQRHALSLMLLVIVRWKAAESPTNFD